MTKKTNLELATEIVIAMINNGKIDRDKNDSRNAIECVTDNLEKIVNKLNELQTDPKPGKAKFM